MTALAAARLAEALRAPATAARWGLVLAVLLASCVVSSSHSAAQSLTLIPASSNAQHKEASRIGSGGEQIRVAQGQKSTANQSSSAATQAAAPAAQPATSKPAPVRKSPPKARSSQTPPQDESLPPPMTATVPLVGAEQDGDLRLTKNGQGLITLIVRDKSLSQVLALIAQTQNLNIVASNDIDALISITLRDVPIEEALSAILSVANYTWVKRNNIIMITSLTDATNLPADVQGRQIQVFDLDFTSATAVAETVKNFLSPIGKVSIGASSPTNSRLSQERIVVEDLPETLCRIAAYIGQIDQPPRQVLIEAHVLEVKLDDVTRCGVNLSQLVRIAGSDLNISTTGFANKDAPQAFLATLTGGDLGGVIELLETSTDAKSLGSPKLLVLNEQEARIQVGETIYYSQVTTTETSSQQGAGSVEAGVILRITPRITRDHRVLLHVSPEISTPGKRETPELPPNISKTTLESDVMLNDNQGMVIGGLIKEKDQTEQQKVPYLGNVKGIGWLFRRSEVTKQRSEIIIALVPRIQPYNCEYQNFEQGELVKAGVPLMYGPLKRTDRPWDPVLPDGKRVSYPLIPKYYQPHNYYTDLGPRYEIPPTPLPRQDMCNEGCVPDGPLGPQVMLEGEVFQNEELPMPSITDELGGAEVISDHP